MKSARVNSLIAWLSALSVIPALFAQTTGRIEGRVHDDSGGLLPGVYVTAIGPSLQGERTVVTGIQGGFRLLVLPPGDYTVTASLDGFNPLEVEDVRVWLDRTTTLEITLSPGFGDELTVSGLAPLIDSTSTTTGTEFPEEVFSQLPVPRTFQALAQLVPGVTDGGLGDNPSIRGASAAENRYVVDGLDVTSPNNGTLFSTLAFEFVQEVEVKTGGYQAEYGGALGGVINVITKSGGNEFRGDLFGYFSDDELQASSPPTQEYGQFLGLTQYDYGFDLGGKLIRDKLWYFAALNPTISEEELTNRQGIVFNPRTERLYYATKLSWQIDPRQNLVVSLFGEQNDENGNPQTAGTNPPALNAAGRIANDSRIEVNNLALNFNSALTSSLFLELTAGRYDQHGVVTPIDDTSPLYTDLTGTGFWAKQQNCGDPGLLNGNDILFAVGCRGGTVEGSNDSSRDQLRGSLSWFSGKHELKGGVAYRSLDNESVFRRPAPSGGPLVDENGLVVDSDGVVGSSFSLRPGFYSLTELDQDSHGKTEEWSLFVQDQWRVTPHLSVNLGVRLDSFVATGDASERLENSTLDFGFDDMIGPRLGFVWDATRNGRSKLFGHFGRFYESVPLAINTLAFGQFGVNLYFFAYPQDGSLPTYDKLGTFLFPFSLGLGEVVDPNTDPMYTDEYILGFEYEVRRDLAVGVTAVSRELGSVVEDISLDGGETFFLTNPGGTYVINPATGEALVEPIVFPRAVREYRSIELTLNKRFTSNWQLFSSYVYSENKGNYGGLFRQDTGLNTPHYTGAFDSPEMLEGAFGPLPNDRTHHFKVYGTYNWPFRLITGFFAQYMSGTPISKLGFDEFGNAERFVTPRGTEGRTPDLAHLDLHLSYPIRLPSSLQLQVIADLFNVTNQQSATAENQIWTFAERQRTVDADECGGPGTGPGTDCPEGNPLWGSAIAFQPPRSLRLGLKLSW